jgi:hypothetical protein
VSFSESKTARFRGDATPPPSGFGCTRGGSGGRRDHLYYVLWYGGNVARTVQARLDDRSEQDLALLRNEGHSDSEAVRLALHEAAELRRRKSALRLEAEAAAADPDDVAEALRVREELDAIAAAWNDLA